METAIALIVSAIPEGIPIDTTIAFAHGILRLSKHHVEIKKLAAVEKLGSTNVIFTDKTGTLTQNRLEVTTTCIPYHTSDIKWHEDDKSVSYHPHSAIEAGQRNLTKLFHVATLFNNASFTDNDISVGDSIEVALLKLGEYHKSGFLEKISKTFLRIYEQPFDSDTKITGTNHEVEGKKFVAVKVAVEEVLKNSTLILKDEILVPFIDADKKKWLDQNYELAKKGMRALVFAYKDHTHTFKNIISDLTFAGLIFFLDFPREEVP